MNDKILWLVGQSRSGDHPNIVWDFQGIFSSEEEAVQATISRGSNYFVARVELGVLLADEPYTFPGAYYPLEGKTDV